MLRNLACRLIHEADKPPLALREIIISTTELCLARYPYCRSQLLQIVNEKLSRLGAEKISPEEFTDAETLLDEIRKRLREYSIDRILRVRHASREQIRESIENTALRIYYSSLMAVLDILGIECPLTLSQGER